MAIKKIGRNSDIEVRVTQVTEAGAPVPANSIPFVFRIFSDGDSTKVLEASYDGRTWVNCKADLRMQNRIICTFDNPQLPTGTVWIQKTYNFSNTNFPDMVQTLECPAEKTNCVLVDAI